MNKAFLKKECGPWAGLKVLFKDGIPIYGATEILQNNVPSYEIRAEELTDEQLILIVARYMWQHEDDPTLSLDKAIQAVFCRCTIPKHWISHVALIGDITIRSEEITDTA